MSRLAVQCRHHCHTDCTLATGMRTGFSGAWIWTPARRGATWRPAAPTLQQTGAMPRCGTWPQRGRTTVCLEVCQLSSLRSTAVLKAFRLAVMCAMCCSDAPGEGGWVTNVCFRVTAGAFADGTALAAAAAGSDSFFSPLSGGVLAPLQQRRLATPDLSPHARRRQLEQEQQVTVALLRASSLCTMVLCLHSALGHLGLF